MDFKDVSSVSAEQSPQGKRQHVIEVGNFVDAGTSIALFAQGRRGLPRTNGDGSGDQLFADEMRVPIRSPLIVIRLG